MKSIKNKNITITKGDTSIKLTSNNLKYQIVKNGFEWVSAGRPPFVTFQKKIFGKFMFVFKRFSSAKKINHTITEDSIISTYSGYKILGKKIDVCFTAVAKILGNGKIDFSIKAENEKDMDIRAMHYPSPFNAVSYDRKNSYTVDPMRQGFMLPDTYKQNRFAIFLIRAVPRKINTGQAYMPVFGRVCGKKGYSGFAQDSHDCTLMSCYGKKKSLLTAFNWLASKGKLAYERVAHYNFYDECDYVTIAKSYRNHLQASNDLITIDEKISRNPNVKNLIGVPIIHWRLLENNVPESKIYKKEKIGMTLRNTFADSIVAFNKLKALGLDKAYVHTDGWGNRGYDNLHPYILPPCDKIGGYEGMRNYVNACKELGYTVALHDQYRDYYWDSPVYDGDKCVVNINGKKPFCNVWSGGSHNWLCSSFAKELVKKTYDELQENGIFVDGVYLDVFGIVQGDECYHPNHSVTRTQSIAHRKDCFDLLRERGLIVSSEEIGCQMINCLDIVHHAPYAVTPQGRGKQVGIPIPLTNLVYHDCVFVPWHTLGKGGWGIPDGDSGLMHCVLNGQSPYYNTSTQSEIDPESDEDLKVRLQKLVEVANINALVYNAEMVSHKFLDSDYRKQQTTYSNGYVITVDFDKDTYTVEKK